ncbi:dynein axonemal assembly factor 3 [Rhynchophorus ferrugineus]|uniref:Dynein assembly factor 3, axonemal homolog n=1 Tax=Rhynchophorus ferrugineus TaxID=354439 RepID=A0A834IRT5_RHYFE|nr:hypothetical protein GWI33_007395 [Rhynchophorus ferrugineus]
MFWGLTPALDLTEEYLKQNGECHDEINILLIGSTDCRHILKTLARRYRHKKVTLNFYIMEACMETVAKQLLLLYISLQPKTSIGLEQKTKVFMELYGNSIIRPFTAKYLTSAASDLIEMITNYEALRRKINFVNLDIKYKDRDYLENLTKFWCGKDEFNIIDCWDRRLRKTLGVRYDSKLGAFDWDLHMRYHMIGGKQVCNQEYRSFRLNGIAFSWLESEASLPNRSMVCAIIPNGQNFVHYGYLGDIQTGPFVAYGLECEDSDFLKSTNGHNAYRATDVTERNLKQIFFEIEHQQEYKHTKINDMQLGSSIIKQDKLIIDINNTRVKAKNLDSCIKIENTQVNILSISQLKHMKYKDKLSNFFNIVYVAHNYEKYFDINTIEHVVKNQGLLLIENQLFLLNNRKKDLESYVNNIEEKVNRLNVTKAKFDVENDCYLRFTINKN